MGASVDVVTRQHLLDITVSDLSTDQPLVRLHLAAPNAQFAAMTKSLVVTPHAQSKMLESPFYGCLVRAFQLFEKNVM